MERTSAARGRSAGGLESVAERTLKFPLEPTSMAYKSCIKTLFD